MFRSACRRKYGFLQLCLIALALRAAASLAPMARAQASSSAELAQNLSFHTQNGGGYGNGGYQQYPKYGENGFHHLAIEAGGGFDAPLGNTKNTQTFGYNFKLGSGYNFSRNFGLLAEYEFNGSGIPNSVLAAQQAPQGNVHVWGLTLDPILYYKTKGAWGGYVTGGGGFYRKLTSFTQPVFAGVVCDFYGVCYPQYSNITLSHFSSNQGGVNIGTGFTHNLGQGGAKVYAEARYLWVDSAKSSPTQIGSGTVSVIPVTVGIRF